MVKELSKICSFTYVFQKKKYCHHSTGKELMILGKMCSQCGQEDLAETVWFEDVPVKSIEEVPVVVENFS